MTPTVREQQSRRKPGKARALVSLGMALCMTASPLALAVPAFAQDVSANAGSLSAQLPSFAPMVQRILPAVVNISVVQKSQSVSSDDEDDDSGNGGGGGGGMPPGFPGSGTPFDEFLKRFFQQQQQGRNGGGQNMAPGQKVMSLGSGFIIDPRGYIVTNNHVIGDADKVTVIFQDDSRHAAKIIGKDEKSDIALLKIDSSKPLPFVTLGDSDKERVGDWVIAIGDPFGLGGTVTKGIISARGRPIEDSSYVDFLQIDAAINKGNSGGPTFNLDGQVIGINTAIYSPNGGSVGIGFAIPSNTAAPVIAQLMKNGHVDRGWLGVQIQEVTADIAQGLGMDRDHPIGALVSSVSENSPASKAGIHVGDVIVKYDGHEVTKMRDLPRMVGGTEINHTVKLTVLRQGKEVVLDTTIGKLTNAAIAATEKAGAPDQQKEEDQPAALGLFLSSLNGEAVKRLGLPAGTKGALVARVKDNSPAANNGVQAGDVIMQVNQQPVTTPGDAAKLIKDNAKKVVLLMINRHGENRFIAITPGDSDSSNDDN